MAASLGDEIEDEVGDVLTDRTDPEDSSGAASRHGSGQYGRRSGGRGEPSPQGQRGGRWPQRSAGGAAGAGGRSPRSASSRSPLGPHKHSGRPTGTQGGSPFGFAAIQSTGGAAARAAVEEDTEGSGDHGGRGEGAAGGLSDSGPSGGHARAGDGSFALQLDAVRSQACGNSPQRSGGGCGSGACSRGPGTGDGSACGADSTEPHSDRPSFGASSGCGAFGSGACALDSERSSNCFSRGSDSSSAELERIAEERHWTMDAAAGLSAQAEEGSARSASSGAGAGLASALKHHQHALSRGGHSRGGSRGAGEVASTPGSEIGLDLLVDEEQREDGARAEAAPVEDEQAGAAADDAAANLGGAGLIAPAGLSPPVHVAADASSSAPRASSPATPGHGHAVAGHHAAPAAHPPARLLSAAESQPQQRQATRQPPTATDHTAASPARACLTAEEQQGQAAGERTGGGHRPPAEGEAAGWHAASPPCALPPSASSPSATQRQQPAGGAAEVQAAQHDGAARERPPALDGAHQPATAAAAGANAGMQHAAPRDAHPAPSAAEPGVLMPTPAAEPRGAHSQLPNGPAAASAASAFVSRASPVAAPAPAPAAAPTLSLGALGPPFDGRPGLGIASPAASPLAGASVGAPPGSPSTEPPPPDVPTFGRAWICRHDQPAQHVPPPPHAPCGTPSFTLCARTGVRPYMEDRCVAQHCALDGGRAHFVALFDGHNGEHAAALAVEQMGSVLAEQLDIGRRAAGTAPGAIAARVGAAGAAEAQSAASGGAGAAGTVGAGADAAAARLSPAARGGAASAELGQILYESFAACNDRVLAKNEELLSQAESSGSFQHASVGGTTAIVCVLADAVAHVASVGDSRAVLARGSRAVRVTTDHKPKLMAEEERIVEFGGFVNRGRVHGILSVSRSLGDFEFAPFVLAEPQVLSFALTDEDRCLLLASDGLWDVISDDEAIEMALRIGTGAGADPTAAGQHLVDEALRRGSRDNVSVVCVFRDVGR